MDLPEPVAPTNSTSPRFSIMTSVSIDGSPSSSQSGMSVLMLRITSEILLRWRKIFTLNRPASFKDKPKALVQRDKLRKSNIAAVFVEQFLIDNQVIYRVRLGPFVKREKADIALNKLKAKHDIDGLVMLYEK